MTDEKNEMIPAHSPHPTRRSPIRPDSYAEMMKVANQCAQSGLYGIKSAQQAFTIMATGDEIGLSPFQALRGIHVIKGQPSIGANLMVALVMQCPDCEYWTVRETTNTTCTIETKRKGHDPQSITWTIEDAKRAQLTSNDNWSKYPRAMLRARAISELARMVYGDIVYGMYTPEELGDIEAVPVRPENNSEAIDAEFDELDQDDEPELDDDWQNANRRFHAAIAGDMAAEFKAAFKRSLGVASIKDVEPMELHKMCSRIAQCQEMGGDRAVVDLMEKVIAENPNPNEEDQTNE